VIRIIGLAGRIGAGKTLAASMVPSAYPIQWADPIYRGLSAMLDIPGEVLRDRTQKERPIEVGGIDVIPRDLLRTLGTEWGRQLVHSELWVRLTMRRVETLHETIEASTFAICGTRFPNEVAAIRERGGEVWWIDRPGLEAGHHASDKQIGPDDCDRVIVNAVGPGELRQAVLDAWRSYLWQKEPPCPAR
jgi:hypothetical protein